MNLLDHLGFYVWWKLGRLCQFTDGKGNIAGFAYNPVGNLSTMTPPTASGAHTFTGEAAGNLATRKGATGTATFTFDVQNRPVVWGLSKCLIAEEVESSHAVCSSSSGWRLLLSASTSFRES